MNISKELSKVLQGFAPITLDDINKHAKLMERKESKYLTTKPGLVNILKMLQENYYLLEIKNFRLFLYDNMYMDSKQLAFYHDHENSKEGRIKFRKRKYVDTGATYIEYKVKANTITDKKRVKLDADIFEQLDAKSKEFFKELYKGGKEIFLLPTMQTTYQRITLCNKVTEERLTIDLNLVFSDPRDTKAPSFKVNDFVIIELKQAPDATDETCKEIITSNGAVLAEGCSKYCLGLIYFNKVDKMTHFQKTVDFIEAHGGVSKVKKRKKARIQTKKK